MARYDVVHLYYGEEVGIETTDPNVLEQIEIAARQRYPRSKQERGDWRILIKGLKREEYYDLFWSLLSLLTQQGWEPFAKFNLSMINLRRVID